MYRSDVKYTWRRCAGAIGYTKCKTSRIAGSPSAIIVSKNIYIECVSIVAICIKSSFLFLCCGCEEELIKRIKVST